MYDDLIYTTLYLVCQAVAAGFRVKHNKNFLDIYLLKDTSFANRRNIENSFQKNIIYKIIIFYHLYTHREWQIELVYTPGVAILFSN